MAAEKEPVFSSYGDGAQGVLSWVVAPVAQRPVPLAIDWRNAAFDESTWCEPLIEGVGDGLGQGFSGAAAELPGVEFDLQCSQEWLAALLSLGATFGARGRGDLAFDLVELANQGEGLLGTRIAYDNDGAG